MIAPALKNQVKVYRAIHDLTQQQLAAKVGVARKTIIAIEAGNYSPSVSLALVIAQVLQTNVHELFWLEN